MLPPFSFETRVSSSTARHDKIQIGLEGGSLIGETEDIRNFLLHLGPTPRGERNARNFPPFGWFFGRYSMFSPAGGSTPEFTQNIRDKTLRVGIEPHRPPLPAGRLAVRHGQSNTWLLEARLSLNPTRFARHQLMPTRLQLFQSGQTLPQSRPQCFKRVLTEPDDEHPYMRCDNWIPNTRLWQQFTSDAFWPSHLRQCLAVLPREVIAEFNRSAELMRAGAPDSRLNAPNRFNLHSLETYWEFLCDDPLGTIQRLRPMMETFAQPIPGDDQDDDDEPQYSTVLRRKTHNGEILKVYAKTDRRIRFEVVHQLRGNNGFRAPRGGHTFASMGRAIQLIEHLTGRAVDVVNDALWRFSRYASVPDGQHTVLKFISDFQEACGNPDRAFRLLQILTNRGSIDVGRDINVGTIYKSELRRLRDKGILVSSHQRYSVTSSYRRALQNMQRVGVGFLLGARHRRKSSSGIRS